MKTIKTILLISTTALGDTLLATPAIRAVKETFPKATVDMLVNAKVKNLLLHNPFIDNLFDYRNNAFIRQYLSWTDLNKRYDQVVIFHANRDILSLLKKLTYNSAINCQNFNDAPLKLRAIDIPYTIHAAERRLRLVESIGAPTEKKSLEMFLDKNDNQSATHFLRRHKILPAETKKILIGIHPGAARPYKCWPIENFSQIIHYLKGKYNANIIMTGHKKENSLFKQLKAKSQDNSLAFTGGLTINQSAAVISRCRLFITNDTGPMHMAFSLGTPTIALFCPSDGITIGPYHTKSPHIVINKAPPCAPCITKKCEDPFCMKSITIDEVITSIDQLLKKQKLSKNE